MKNFQTSRFSGKKRFSARDLIYELKF